ncbi:MAG TPA: hypothetical protein VK851_00845, partial [Anaerolineales bacterium]|nr:hypothetical protein [Anaerolineales bacterium]
IGFTKIVLKGIDGPVNETQETDLTTVFNAGQRTLGLISYLVEIARLNKGTMNPSREESNASEIIKEAAASWKTQNTAKPLNMDVNISNPIFQVDKAQIRQIISHLLTFAALRITEGTVTLSANDSEDSLKVRIHSNGKKGVDKFEMDSAMLKFVASSLIKLHGGQMDDPEETDDGLMLRFSIPR